MGLRDTHLAPNAIGGFGGCWSLHPRKPLDLSRPHISGPARGFGYTVSRAILIQVYGSFWSKFGHKVFSFSCILGIRYMVQKSLHE